MCVEPLEKGYSVENGISTCSQTLVLGQKLTQEMEHGKEVARGHQHVVAEPTSNDRVMHDRFVGLVLEVRVPPFSKVRGRPLLEIFQLLLSRSDLGACIDAVGRQWPRSPEVPLLKDTCDGGQIPNSTPCYIARGVFLRFCTSGSPRAKSSNVSVPGLARKTLKVR